MFVLLTQEPFASLSKLFLTPSFPRSKNPDESEPIFDLVLHCLVDVVMMMVKLLQSCAAIYVICMENLCICLLLPSIVFLLVVLFSLRKYDFE